MMAVSSALNVMDLEILEAVARNGREIAKPIGA